MFESTSRYYTLENATLESQDGRIIAYKRRRFLPDGNKMPQLVEVTVTQGDRLDLITPAHGAIPSSSGASVMPTMP